MTAYTNTSDRAGKTKEADKRRMKKHSGENTYKSISEKAINIYLLILMLAVTAMVFFLATKERAWLTERFNVYILRNDYMPPSVYKTMTENASFLGDSVMVLLSITAMFVIFYYGLLGTKNFGLTKDKSMEGNRKNSRPVDVSSEMAAERIHIPVPVYESSKYRNEDDEILFLVNTDEQWPLSPRIRRNTFLGD